MSGRGQLALALSTALVTAGCSPLLGLVVRAVESGGGGDIRVGESRRGNTRAAADDWTPACGAQSGGGDDAYAFVPERGGTYRVDVRAGYDCVVAVFDEERESVACNDDTGETSHSQVDVRLEAGRRYTIVVDGYRDATGSYTLQLSALQLDDLIEVTDDPDALALDAERQGDTRGRPDTRTPPCGSTPGSPDQTWGFTPPEEGTYRIDVSSDFDGTLAIYPPGGSEPLACNDDEGSTRASRVTASLSAGTRYEVVVDGYHGATGTYRIRASALGGGAGSNTLTAGTPVRGDTRGQPDTRTPGCGSRPGSPDQTWLFTPSRTGAVQLHVDSDYDSVLAIYEQGGSTPLQCNDDYQSTRMSRLTQQVQAGRTYEVVIDGYSGSAGSYMLRATEITSAGGGPITLGQTVQGNTAAGTDRITPGCGSRGGSPDETWTFTAPGPGMYRFHVNAQYDSVLAVYTNPSTQLACNDDHGSTRASRIEASLSAGQNVQIVVDGFQGQQGAYSLQVTRLSTTPPPLPPAPASIENIRAMEARCPNATALTPGTHTVQIQGATADARTTCGGGAGGGEVLYSIQVQQPTVLHVTAEGRAGPILELRAGCSQGHSVVACDASAPQSALHARLEPNRSYILVVDSRGAGDAETELEVQMQAVAPTP